MVEIASNNHHSNKASSDTESLLSNGLIREDINNMSNEAADENSNLLHPKNLIWFVIIGVALLIFLSVITIVLVFVVLSINWQMSTLIHRVGAINSGADGGVNIPTMKGSDTSKEFLTGLPSGVLTDMTTDTLSSINGCWQSCYNARFDSSLSYNDLLSFNSIEDECQGDFVFVATRDDLSQTKFIVGAFARKGIFSRSFHKNFCLLQYSSNSIDSVIIDGNFENQVYWYAGYCSFYGSFTYGFSSKSSVLLQIVSGINNIPTYINYPLDSKADSTSWGSRTGAVGTSNKLYASSLSETTRYSRVIYTNTCNVTV